MLEEIRSGLAADGPTIAVVRAAGRDGLAVGRIGEVRVVDPYFHGGGS